MLIKAEEGILARVGGLLLGSGTLLYCHASEIEASLRPRPTK